MNMIEDCGSKIVTKQPHIHQVHPVSLVGSLYQTARKDISGIYLQRKKCAVMNKFRGSSATQNVKHCKAKNKLYTAIECICTVILNKKFYYNFAMRTHSTIYLGNLFFIIQLKVSDKFILNVSWIWIEMDYYKNVHRVLEPLFQNAKV